MTGARQSTPDAVAKAFIWRLGQRKLLTGSDVASCCQSILLSIRIRSQESNARMRLWRRGVTEMPTAAQFCSKEKSVALKAAPDT
jgi:hypothetical protein